MRTFLFKECPLRKPEPSEHVEEGLLIIANPKTRLPIATVWEREVVAGTVFDVCIVLVPHRKNS